MDYTDVPVSMGVRERGDARRGEAKGRDMMMMMTRDVHE